MELPEEDIEALRELVTNGRQARPIRWWCCGRTSVPRGSRGFAMSARI